MTAPRQTSNRRVQADAAVAAVPDMEWSQVHKYVSKSWDPTNRPHHSIIGLTGSGKSYLAINGILRPMCSNDRVLLIDTKGDDPTLSGAGTPCKAIPDNSWGKKLGRRPEPFSAWHRLVVDVNPEKTDQAKQQVYTALKRVYNDGNWVVYLDEIRDITSPKIPSLGLESYVDYIYRKGRSKSISIIAATQAPRYCPTSFYDQASFSWIGYLRDRDKQKRLLEIGGLDKSELPVIENLEPRHWLLCADSGRHIVRTTVKVAA